MNGPSTIDLVISTNGTTRSIYDDRIDLKSIGRVTVERASHVEPTPQGDWYADLSPVNGPNTLGPFGKRSEALAAEVAWLQQNWLARSNE